MLKLSTHHDKTLECELQVFSRYDLQHLLRLFTEHSGLEQHKKEFNTDSQIEMKAKVRALMEKKMEGRVVIGNTRQERWANAALGEVESEEGEGEGKKSRGLYSGGVYSSSRNVKREELYTIETLMQRAELIDDPLVADSLDKHWSAVTGFGRKKRGGVIYEDEFIELSIRLQRCTAADSCPMYDVS